MTTELVTMTKGDSTAIVRPEWVETWRGYGYEVEAATEEKRQRGRPRKAEAEEE